MTKAQQLQEFLKCKNNPIYFIETYVQLELAGANELMILCQPQKDLLLSILNDHHTIALKSRQIGISTIVQAFIAYTFTFYDNIVAGIVSKDQAEATDFCRKVMSMIEYLPEWMRPIYIKQTEQTFILKNGCKFYAQTVNPKNPGKLFRGKSITIAVMDEAAHTDYIEKAWVGFGPALIKSQTDAKRHNAPYATIVLSTPNGCTGTGKWYYESWKEANTIGSIYKPHTIHWKQVPWCSNDPNWYIFQCKLLKNNQQLIRQELELEFIAKEGSFFPADTVEKLNKCNITPIKILTIEGFSLKIWEDYNPTRFYLIGIDTASSHGGDNSTIEVFDYETMRQVSEYQGKLRIDNFCKVIEKVNALYKNNIIVPENNSYGEAVCEHLTKNESAFKYNIYYDYKKFKYGDNKKIVYGLSTTATTRPLLIDSLYNYVTENTSIIKSTGLALELIGLEQNIRGRVEAGKGEKDDLCLATSFCTYVRSYEPAIKSRFGSKTFANETTSEVLLLNEDSNEANFNSELEKITQFNKYKFDTDEEERKTILMQKNIALKRSLKKAIDEKDIHLNLSEIIYGNSEDPKGDGDFLFFDDGSGNKNNNGDIDPDLDI
jgi:hypothetical protein